MALLRRLRALFRRDTITDEISEELQFHIDARADEWRRRGIPAAEAQRRARDRFGNVARLRDEGYDVRGGGVMETIWQDLKFAVRLWKRQPGFALTAVLTLAIGIGAVTAIFSVAEATLLRPLPYPHPEQLMRVGVQVPRPDGTLSRPTPSSDDMRWWQGQRDVFSLVAGFGSAFGGTIADGDELERISVIGVTEDYFRVYGTTVAFGREFTREDMNAAAPPVVILGHGYWQRKFGGREDVVGQTLRYDNLTATVIGVMPPSFNRTTPVFRPLRIAAEEQGRRGTGRVSVVGRLQPGLTLDEAQARLTAAMPAGERTSLTSLLETAQAGSRTTVYVLASAVGFILLIACVNVAGLLLGRSAARQAELAVRASLGAGRTRLVRQLLTESVLLALAGSALGVTFAWLGLDALVANIPLSISTNAPVQINLPVLAATLGLVIPTALIFGLYPALRVSRGNLTQPLACAGRQHAAGLSRRGGRWLIGVEVALAVVLLAGAGLMLRSFSLISAVDLGFEPDRLITMEVVPVGGTPATHADYYHRLRQSLRQLPGVEAVGAVNNFPLAGSTSFSSVKVDGTSVGINPFQVLPGYGEALGLPVRAGALPADTDTTGAFVSEAAARAMFADTPALGRQFSNSTGTMTYTVRGVVADSLHGGPFGETLEAVYLPFVPSDTSVRRGEALTFVLRVGNTPPGFAGQLREAATSIGPRVLVERIRSGDEWLATTVVTPRRRMVLLTLLGTLGLVLTLIGVFGMTAYAVARRTQEIGIRMVFGAQSGQVVSNVVRDTLLPVSLGIVAGLVGAGLSTRAIQSFLFQTDPVDIPTFTGVAVVLLLTGCFAAWLPARRAARINPIDALRG